ncbi:MAG: DNA repair exonuclease [Candidatus Micrarchaeaceae archaeon]|jgi:DNA repair exonuclease SbcCD nuclease subunit
MKIAIVSDMHIGYERFAEDAFNQAKEALEKASSMADAIILPGDIFDKRAPKPEVIAQAINLFRDLSRKEWKVKVSAFDSKTNQKYTDVPIIAISGTHERTAMGKENPLGLLALAGLLVDTSESTTMLEKNGEKVAIFGLGGLSDERVKEKLLELDPKPTEGAFNIFMFHQSTYELLPFSNEFIHNEDLPKGFDLYVNGHIHSRFEGTIHGKKFVIPGSTVLTQLKEGEQEEKGFILFDTSNYNYEFIKINCRKFVFKNIKFDNADPKEIKEKCEKEIEQILSKESKMPIIKLRLEGSIDSGFNNTDIPLQSIIVKYSQKALIEIDNSRLQNIEMQSNIDNLRENKIGNMPVKELGMSIFGSKLKEAKFDESINYSELFNILSNNTKKEKAISEALEFLNK